MVTSVPWQLASSQRRADAEPHAGRSATIAPAQTGRAVRAGTGSPDGAGSAPDRDRTLTAPPSRGRAGCLTRCSARCSSCGWARPRTAGTASPGRRRAARPRRVRPARPAGRAGPRAWSPRTRAGRSAAPTPSRCSNRRAGPGRAAVPARGAGPMRRLRLAARVRVPRSARSRPTSCASSSPGWPAWTSRCEVEELPGGLLGWRTRTVYAVDDDGAVGLRRHRSHDIERAGGVPARRAGRRRRARPSTTLARTATRRRGGPRRRRRGDRARAPARAGAAGTWPAPARPRRGAVDGPPTPSPRRSPDGPSRSPPAAFWQVHPHAAATFAAALLGRAAPAAGRDRAGPLRGRGPVHGAARAMPSARPGRCSASSRRDRRVADAASEPGRPAVGRGPARPGDRPTSCAGSTCSADLVVLDPPRAGAGADVMAAVLAQRPRAIGYVACDPASLARDVRVARRCRVAALRALRAFDAFPMTHHVECIALLEPRRSRPHSGCEGSRAVSAVRTSTSRLCAYESRPQPHRLTVGSARALARGARAALRRDPRCARADGVAHQRAPRARISVRSS